MRQTRRMAFKYNHVGVLVTEDPQAAYKRLEKAFSAHGGNVKKTAEEFGVNSATVFRWLKRLESIGDPRNGARGKAGRHPCKPRRKMMRGAKPQQSIPPDSEINS